MDNIDFAWLASDVNSKLAVFYSSYQCVPDKYRPRYTFDRYNEMTSYLIDELDVICESKFLEHWAEYDSNKGLFVYSVSDDCKLATCVGTPSGSRLLSDLSDFDELVVRFESVDFDKSIELNLDSQ